MSRRCVLVTGASGFVGRQVVAALSARDAEVHAAGRAAPSAALPGVEWHPVDLLDASRAKQLVHELRPTHLVHLAWYATHNDYWTNPLNLRWVGATLQLLEAFTSCGGQRAVIAGTCAEYDWGHGRCLEDQTPLVPQKMYGASKHATHVAAQAWCAQYGVELAWARLFNLFGEHEHPTRLVASLIRKLLAGQRAECQHGQLERDFLDVAAAGDAFAELCFSSLQGAVNVASGRPITLGALTERLGALTGRPELVSVDNRPTRQPVTLTADVRRLGARGPGIDAGLKKAVQFWSTHESEKNSEP